MADNIEWGRFSDSHASAPAERAVANAVAPTWQDDIVTSSTPIERFWLPIAVGILTGWGAIAFLLVTTFGWAIVAGVAGVMIVGSVSAVAIARTGQRDVVEVTPQDVQESEDYGYSKAA